MAKPGLVFFGNERLSSARGYDQAPILASLISQNYNLEALVISGRRTKSRQAKEPAVARLAREHGLSVVEVTTPAELKERIAALKAEFAVAASFGFLIGPASLKHFRLGIVNVHPSLLPLYRGPTPIETALLNGDAQTGVSLMRLEEELDAGGIYAQQRLAIRASETKLSLTSRLGELASRMLADTLPLIWRQELPSRAQNHRLATYTEPIKAGPPLDFQQHDAEHLERHIRAFAGCPNSKFSLNRRLVEVLEARAESNAGGPDIDYDKPSNSLRIKCRRGQLTVTRLRPAGQRAMSAGDFVNGFYRQLSSR